MQPHQTLLLGLHLARTEHMRVVGCQTLTEVIYRTPAESVEDASRRNDWLFAHYGQGDGWTEILDNGFGRTYRRTDQQRYALWSYAMDITTFGTMGFHQVKW